VEIVVDDLTGPQIASFLDEHVREMLSITPPESKHALDLETLREPGITFWSVMDGGTVVGCGALKRLDARHAEVKSMRTLTARKRHPGTTPGPGLNCMVASLMLLELHGGGNHVVSAGGRGHRGWGTRDGRLWMVLRVMRVLRVRAQGVPGVVRERWRS
jgi:hypothetical protein